MPVPGDLLADRYRIGALLGAGGMATVHRGHDERLDRDVAIKVLLPNLANDPAVARRFEREARAMAAVADPGLVAVFDVDPGDAVAGREPFVVMELCPGGSLADRLAPGHAMAPDDLIPILVAVANGLAALHRAGLAHRDVKPSNILFAVDRVKLGDFGLARAEKVTDAGDLTEPGTAVGTLAYLAPERLRGDPGGPPADIYALATVAHVGLTGTMPRAAGSVRDVVNAASLRPPAVSTAAPRLGREFDEIVLAALAVDPARRPDALAFGAGLGAALGRWTRSGRSGAPVAPAGIVAAAPVEVDADVTSAIASTVPRAAPNHGTTATAIDLEGSAAGPPSVDDAPPRRTTPAPPASRRSSAWGRLVAAAAAVGAIVLVLAIGGRLLSPGSPAAGASTGSLTPSRVPASAAASSSAAPSTRPTAAPSAAPTQDPAIAALNDVDAAIAAARGGHDGLKGKEANELAAMAGRVRTDLAAGNRSTALKDARELDRRARDAAERLGDEAGGRLTTATAKLVRVLGG